MTFRGSALFDSTVLIGLSVCMLGLLAMYLWESYLAGYAAFYGLGMASGRLATVTT